MSMYEIEPTKGSKFARPTMEQTISTRYPAGAVKVLIRRKEAAPKAENV